LCGSDIRNQVYFTSRDNEHKIPNNPNDPVSNLLTDANFAKTIKNKADMSATELAGSAVAYYEVVPQTNLSKPNKFNYTY